MDELTHTQKIEWMAVWAAKNNLQLKLEGTCGFGRDCVGVIRGENYPDYEWYDKDTDERLDNNGEVWVPKDAYHKHTCVAVLGRGERAEAQLYDWLKWFDDNGFVLEESNIQLKDDPVMRQIQMLMGQHRYARMVKKEQVNA